MDFTVLVNAIRANRLIYTPHALREAQQDHVSLMDIRMSVALNGEIIEDYPHDPSGPSCLIYSELHEQEPLHSCWGYQQIIGYAILITVYRPDEKPEKWSPDFRQRRKKQGS